MPLQDPAAWEGGRGPACAPRAVVLPRPQGLGGNLRNGFSRPLSGKPTTPNSLRNFTTVSPTPAAPSLGIKASSWPWLGGPLGVSVITI